MQPAAGGALVEDHKLLALLKAPERRRERADVHRLRRHIQKMREHPPDFAIKHPDELSAPGNSELQQLFRRQAECMLLVHRSDIVEPIEIWNRLQISLGFDQFLCAAMQKADMRVYSLDHFAIEVEHQAQHAMRSRMLRPKVHGETAQLGFRHGHSLLTARRLAPRSSVLFRGEPRVELVPCHNKTLMTPLPDRINSVAAFIIKLMRGPSTATHSASTRR